MFLTISHAKGTPEDEVRNNDSTTQVKIKVKIKVKFKVKFKFKVKVKLKAETVFAVAAHTASGRTSRHLALARHQVHYLCVLLSAGAGISFQPG